jgi:hypothetical protein
MGKERIKPNYRRRLLRLPDLGSLQGDEAAGLLAKARVFTL